MALSYSDYTPYVVQQGDHLRKIAFRFDVPADTLWKDPKNSPVAQLRGSGDLLAPGDLLFVPKKRPPGVQIVAGATNRYQADIPTIRIHVAVVRTEGPLANEPFQAVAGDAERSFATGHTSADGGVILDVPIHVRAIELRLPRAGIVLPVRIGDLDPLSERQGVVQRLQKLALLPAGPADDAALASALRAYQRTRGLDLTGVATSATRDSLEGESGA